MAIACPHLTPFASKESRRNTQTASGMLLVGKDWGQPSSTQLHDIRRQNTHPQNGQAQSIADHTLLLRRQRRKRSAVKSWLGATHGVPSRNVTSAFAALARIDPSSPFLNFQQALSAPFLSDTSCRLLSHCIQTLLVTRPARRASPAVNLVAALLSETK